MIWGTRANILSAVGVSGVRRCDPTDVDGDGMRTCELVVVAISMHGLSVDGDGDVRVLSHSTRPFPLVSFIAVRLFCPVDDGSTVPNASRCKIFLVDLSKLARVRVRARDSSLYSRTTTADTNIVPVTGPPRAKTDRGRAPTCEMQDPAALNCKEGGRGVPFFFSQWRTQSINQSLHPSIHLSLHLILAPV